MNLLQLLLEVMLTKKTVNSVSKKTGISSALVKKLILFGVPLLIKYMTKNASSKDGALSLLNALTQHNSKRSFAEQVDDVDEVDGGKIIGHILGNDRTKVVDELATETGLKTKEVDKGLGAIAPALLSGLALATTLASSKKKENSLDLSSLLGTLAGASQQSNKPETFDLGDVLGLLGGVQQQPQQTTTQSLLGTLLGGSKPQQQQPQSAELLNALFGAAQQQPEPQGLLGSLFGGTQTQQQAQSTIDGSDLLNVLTALMK